MIPLFTTCLLLLTPPAEAPAPSGDQTARTVPLLAHASVPGTRIRLVDLVDADYLAGLSEQLRDTDLGRAPSPGFGRRFTRAEVESLLDGTVASDVSFDGAEEVVVTSDVVTIHPDTVVAAAEAHLRENVELDGTTLVEIERMPREVKVPRGRQGRTLQPRLRGTSRLGNSRGRVPLNVEVLVDGKLQAVVPVALLVRTFADVPVLARSMSRGEELRESDVAFRNVETTSMSTMPPTSIQIVEGQVAKRNLNEGTTLRSADFESAVLIKRNDAVTLVFAKGGLRAESFGISRDTGRLGDTVRVENLSTKKTLVGRVAGRGLVQMNP